MMLSKLLEKEIARLFTLYVVFAGFATLVDIGILYSLSEFAGLWYFYSAIVSYAAGMVTNYSLNKYLNFRNKSKRIIPQFSLFMAVALVGLTLNQAIIYSLVEFFGVWYIFAKLMAIAIVMFWSFFGHKKLTFSVLK